MVLSLGTVLNRSIPPLHVATRHFASQGSTMQCYGEQGFGPVSRSGAYRSTAPRFAPQHIATRHTTPPRITQQRNEG